MQGCDSKKPESFRTEIPDLANIMATAVDTDRSNGKFILAPTRSMLTFGQVDRLATLPSFGAGPGIAQQKRLTSMSSFTTRVQLHDADGSDYDELYKAMKAEGFVDVIRSDGGQSYKLPPAEYDIVSNLTRAQILSKAKVAAGKTGKAFAVLVTESAGTIWYNLATVEEPIGIGLGMVRRS